MSQRNMRSGDPLVIAKLTRFAMEHQNGFPQVVVYDLDLIEAKTSAPTGSQGLEKRFLRRESGGEVHGRTVLGITVCDFTQSKQLLLETVGAGQRVLDSLDFDDVRTHSENQ
jgi:hypothetical protein